jgi:xanthine/uracil permease
MTDDRTRQRRIRWAIGGALVLAAVAIVLGTIFNVVIAYALGDLSAETGVGEWAWFLLGGVLAWGGGALFFGAVLGMFASMIWRDDSA